MNSILLNCRRYSAALAAATLAGVLMVAPHPAQAQDEAAPTDVAPTTTARFYIELQDASLADALEMIFKAAGNPSHIIDESAKSVNLAAITFQNVPWDSAMRQLANQNNFKVRRNEQGAYVIEPRTPPPTETGEGGFTPPGGFIPGGSGGFAPGGRGGRGGSGGFAPGGAGGSGSGSGVPANPFGGTFGGRGGRGGRTQPSTQMNQQTAPALGGGEAGSDTDMQFWVIPVQHVYVGGIAQLFSGAGLIRTEQFIPSQSGGGFGNNQNGNQQGGFGGQQQGGFGGQQQGGFGGQQGGFGGQQQGGFGGGFGGQQQGGFGGGFGGQQGGGITTGGGFGAF